PLDEWGEHSEGEYYRQVWTRELEGEPGVRLGRRKKKLDVCSQEKRVHHRGRREVDEKPSTREEWSQKQADGYEDQSVRHDEPRGPPGTNDRGEHRDADGGVIFLCDHGEAPEVTRSPDEDERTEQPRGERIRRGHRVPSCQGGAPPRGSPENDVPGRPRLEQDGVGGEVDCCPENDEEGRHQIQKEVGQKEAREEEHSRKKERVCRRHDSSGWQRTALRAIHARIDSALEADRQGERTSRDR